MAPNLLGHQRHIQCALFLHACANFFHIGGNLRRGLGALNRRIKRLQIRIEHERGSFSTGETELSETCRAIRDDYLTQHFVVRHLRAERCMVVRNPYGIQPDGTIRIVITQQIGLMPVKVIPVRNGHVEREIRMCTRRNRSAKTK